MGKDFKVINLSDYQKKYEEIDKHVQEYLNRDDPDVIKIDNDLIKKEDWKGLVEHREAMHKRFPDDYDWEYLLPEAYMLNKEHDKAIEFLTKLHIKDPKDDNIHYLILEVLFDQGKDENAFNWRAKPSIVELDKNTLDYSFKILTESEKNMELHSLYCSLMIKGFIRFKEEEFMTALKEDGRFEVREKEDFKKSIVRRSK